MAKILELPFVLSAEKKPRRNGASR